MSITYFREPQLDKPVLVASWPGIGNIGMLAVDSLNKLVGGEEGHKDFSALVVISDDLDATVQNYV